MTARFESVRVRKPSGAIIETPLANVQEVMPQVAQNYPMFTDWRMKVIPVSGLEVGDVLECVSEQRIENPIVAGQFFGTVNRTFMFPVRSESIVVDLPAGRAIGFELFGSTPVSTSEEDGRVVRRWEYKDYEPTVGTVDPVFVFSTFTSWDEFGAWYTGILKEPMEVTPELKDLADSLVEGVSDPQEKVRRIYEYVSQSIRYVSVSFGLGAYRPHAASTTHANLYGDCKDKHVLLAALLSAVGIEAVPALINAGVDRKPSVPSPEEFNHLLSKVLIGGNELWVDATSGFAPMGVLSPGFRGEEAVVIHGGTARVEQIPDSGPVPDSAIATWDGELDSVGDLEAAVHLDLSGVYSLPFRSSLAPLEKSQVQAVLEIASMAFDRQGTKSDLKLSDPTDLSGSLALDYVTKTEFYFHPMVRREKISVPTVVLSFLNWDLPEPDDEGKEQQEEVINLGGPIQLAETITLTLAEETSVELPELLEIEEPFAIYSSRYALQDRNLVVVRDLRVLVREVSPDLQDSVRELSEAIEADRERSILFTRTADVDLMAIVDRLSAAELAEAGAELTRERDFTQATALAEAAEGKGPESGRTWAMIGWTYLVTGDFVKAREALEAALHVEPENEYAQEMLSDLLEKTGTPAERLEWSEKLAGRDASDVDVLLDLARNQLVLGKNREAEATLLRALKLDEGNPALLVELGGVRLRLGLLKEAREHFQSALEQDRSPDIYNNIAYALAEAAVDLDLAYDYASSAVTRVQAEVQLLDSLRGWRQSLAMQISLARYLDTLGMVELKRDRASEALDALQASYRMLRNKTVAEHALAAAMQAGEHETALLYYGVISMMSRAQPFGKEEQVPLDAGLGDYVSKEVGDREDLHSYLISKTRELLTLKGNFWPSKGDFERPNDATTAGVRGQVLAVLLIGKSGEILDSLAVHENEPWAPHALSELRKVPWSPVKLKGSPLVSLRIVLFDIPAQGTPTAHLTDMFRE